MGNRNGDLTCILGRSLAVGELLMVLIVPKAGTHIERAEILVPQAHFASVSEQY